MIAGKKIRTHEIFLALLLGAILILWLKPFPHDISICIFKNVTGIPCPACGTGHGMEALLKGHFHAAWSYNPLSYVLITGGILMSLILLNDYSRKQNKLDELLSVVQNKIHFRNPVTWLLILIIVSIWIKNIFYTG